MIHLLDVGAGDAGRIVLMMGKVRIPHSAVPVAQSLFPISLVEHRPGDRGGIGVDGPWWRSLATARGDQAAAGPPSRAPAQLGAPAVRPARAGDLSRLPRLVRFPGGRRRYVYRRGPGDPPLSARQIQALLRNPPTYRRERRTIRPLLDRLRQLGVDVELTSPRQRGAAGEWEPRRATSDPPHGGQRRQ